MIEPLEVISGDHVIGIDLTAEELKSFFDTEDTESRTAMVKEWIDAGRVAVVEFEPDPEEPDKQATIIQDALDKMARIAFHETAVQIPMASTVSWELGDYEFTETEGT